MVAAWQEVGGEGDWAANAIKLAERVDDALATNKERAGRVNKRSINAMQLFMEIYLSEKFGNG